MKITMLLLKKCVQYNYLTRFLAVFCLYISACSQATETTQASNKNATILIYHHVSDSTPPSTSISPTKFKEHLDYLKEHHEVVSLSVLVGALQSNAPLPDMAVAITFDDGFRNVLDNAHSLLVEYGFPYTIFVNPKEVGSSKSHLTWQELKTMSQEGALIASHYLDHRHLLQESRQENWLIDTRTDIEEAEQAIIQHIGHSPRYLAYPFGEYNEELASMITEMGIVGFAQHSGGVGNHTKLAEIPRFPAAGIYANLNSLKVKLRSLAMPVLENSIGNPAFFEIPKMDYSLTLDTADFSRTQFTCYLNGETVTTRWQGNQVFISSDQMLKPGRSRTNCTVPSISKSGRYYWHSQPWFIADEDGNWLD